MSDQPLFWSDQLAFAVTQKFSEKDKYVCASGITPSGIVHIGNFREIITTDFVVKSLKERDEEVRFVYSWDDYDRFRKVPENVPDEWEQYIGLPVSEVPDPTGEYDSYAEYFISKLEDQIEDMHLDVEFIRQSEMFKKSEYADLIKKAMNNRKEIRRILNQYRKEPLSEDYYPLRAYCKECGKDFTEITGYDGEYTIEYSCEECGEDYEMNFMEEGNVKPPWRVDWPMRWHYEDVSFEPGGKDHSAAGSSRDTGTEIIEKVYDDEPPIYQMYDFVKVKGSDKKISSSSGEDVLTLNDLKDVYSPEMIRFLFSERKPKRELVISFDEDIIPRYNKFDKIEKAYYNPESIENDRKRKHWKRVYGQAMVDIPEEQPLRIPFKHASFIAQVIPEENWEDKAIESLKATEHIETEIGEREINQVLQRLQKAKNWARHYAPEDYKYKINFEVPENVISELSENQTEAVRILVDKLEENNFETSDDVDTMIFEAKDESSLDTGEFFNTLYSIMLSREQGPRLSTLILAIGVEDSLEILKEV